MLEFDAEQHRYRWQGVLVPGVTSLLEHLHSFAGVPEDVLEAGRKRGSHAHKACELWDNDELDEDALRRDLPGIVPYLEAWKKFTRDCRPAWRAIETPVYHRLHSYAGTPDRFGDFHVGNRFIDDGQLDIKTSVQLHPVWGVQTAAYNEAAGRSGAPRFTCQLLPDGTYRLREWTEATDWPVFLSLLNLYHWKARIA